jgi:ATP-dependent Clp protease ATP-binding subunit ClpA
MEVWQFPVLCVAAPGDHVCARLVGLDWELVGPSAKRLKALFAKRLLTELDRGLERPMRTPQLTVRPVSARPGYRRRDGHYPAPAPVTVPVAAVHGEEDGAFVCHLPLLGEAFHYYRESQLDGLIEHFARERFQAMTPEELHRFLLPGRPWLDFVPLKVKGERRPKEDRALLRLDAMLDSIADRYPRPKGARRRLHVFPTLGGLRPDLVQAVVSKLLQENANVLLVGEPGVGKSAVLMEAIDRAENRSFWRTTPRRMIAGARWLGDWQEIVERLALALEASRDILWIDGIVDLLRVGGEGPEDSVAAYLQPRLDRGELQIVGELTPSELDAARARLPGFIDRFQIVRVEELPRERMLAVIDGLRDNAKQAQKVDIERRAAQAACRLLARHVRYESFPGKAVSFLAQCVNDALLRERATVTERDVLDEFGRRTGLPDLLLRDDATLDDAALRAHFARRILGQDEAVARLCRVVKVAKTGLNDPGRPVATLLFAGPTGVGKTASAKALAEFFFGRGGRDPLVRLDMSELQHPAQIERLIGSADGPGTLLEQIRSRPFSVLLLDEIEKAHPAFFDALLGVLDEGRLLDAFGRAADFRGCIVVMTTNVGTRREGSLGFGPEAPDRYDAEIRAFFRPEFVNRIDQLLTFRPLEPEVVLGIARKELEALREREGIVKRGTALEFGEGLVRHLAAAGFDRVYGARPLQRAIERLVVGPLSKWLLANAAPRRVRLDWAEGLVLEKA